MWSNRTGNGKLLVEKNKLLIDIDLYYLNLNLQKYLFSPRSLFHINCSPVLC